MTMERAELLDQVLDRYTAWYDVERLDESEQPLVAKAVYHEHNVSYAISQKAEMWSTDRHEYVYFFSVPRLTAEIYDTCFARGLALGEQLVEPKKGHMSSDIVIIFLCDHVDGDAQQKVKSCRMRKSFQFSLKGWMQVQTVAVDLEEAAVCANPAGIGNERFLDLILHPEKRKKKKRGLFQAIFK